MVLNVSQFSWLDSLPRYAPAQRGWSDHQINPRIRSTRCLVGLGIKPRSNCIDEAGQRMMDKIRMVMEGITGFGLLPDKVPSLEGMEEE